MNSSTVGPYEFSHSVTVTSAMLPSKSYKLYYFTQINSKVERLVPIKQGGVQQLHIYIEDGKGEDASFFNKKK
jgi:hypothetical protein